MVIGREDGKKGEGRVPVTVSLDSLIFVFSIYGNSTEKVRVLVRVRVRKKHNIFMYGYGNKYGSFSLEGTEKWTEYGLVLSSGKYGTITGKNGRNFWYGYGYGIRVTFSFISTGTGSVPVPVLRGMVQTQ